MFTCIVCFDLQFVFLFSAVCTPPFPNSLNEDVLFKLKGDIFAGGVKTEVEEISVKVII